MLSQLYISTDLYISLLNEFVIRSDGVSLDNHLLYTVYTDTSTLYSHLAFDSIAYNCNTFVDWFLSRLPYIV